jgi:CTP synthase
MNLKRSDTLYVHVTFLPYIGATGELKTKPTQHSVRDLRSAGIQPNVIIARTDYPVSKDVVDKIALFCDVDEDAVIPLVTTDLLYEVPLVLEDAGLGDYLIDKLKLDEAKPDLNDWRKMIRKMRSASETIRIAVVGKYIELHDAYISMKEATFHAASAHGYKVEMQWIHSSDLEKGKSWDELKSAHGIIVPGGFGYRGVEGKILAARYARENKVPYLGLCLGMQVMCIEFARNVLGLEDANSSEFETPSQHNVIDLMLEQRGITEMGGTMRLGFYPCKLEPGSKASIAYGEEAEIRERHRHRFEFNNSYRADFAEHGARFSGLSPDGLLVEIMEIVDHPFMLGSQFHPEFASRPNAPHPLFLSFVEASIDRKRHSDSRDGAANGHVPQGAVEAHVEETTGS